MTDEDVTGIGSSPSTSTTLLYRVKEMDAAAWERFVHFYGPLVYHWCKQSGLQDADASDIGQDVFQSVLKGIANYNHDQPGGSFRGWLRVITRNKVRDFARRKRASDTGTGGSSAQDRLNAIATEPDEAEPPGDPNEQAILYRRAVEMVLADCQEATRQAFLRVVVDGHDPADVAQDLGLTVNAVYLAKSRIKKRLRDEFADLLDP